MRKTGRSLFAFAPRLSAASVGITALLLACLLPFAALIYTSTVELNLSLWGHLSTTILPKTLFSTLHLLTILSVVVVVIGVGTAWLVTMCSFPGRRFFAVGLLLPLAMPTYVSAFAYVEFLDYSGPVQGLIRDILDVRSTRDYWFPEYRTTTGAALAMSFVLYPYVYLTSRSGFLFQTSGILEAARTLGATPWKVFFRVALPLIRPAVIVGLTLALLEAINDIGAAEFFGVRTLTTTIFDTWLNRSSIATAAQMALILLILVAFLLWLERRARQARGFSQTTASHKGASPFVLKGRRAAFAIILCFLPILFGFLIPVLVMLEASLYSNAENIFPLGPLLNTLGLATLGTLATLIAACLVAYLTLTPRFWLKNAATRTATLGYAVPGTIIGIGVLIPLAAFDNWFDSLVELFVDKGPGLMLSGSAFILIYAYLIRFLPLGSGTIETGLQRLSPNFGFAARTLGRSQTAVLKEVYLPLLRPALTTAAILIFVECMKELPATILLRPFNFETLSTSVYAAASLEAFDEGAIAALLIVLAGLLPVSLLAAQQNIKGQKRA